jgi:hypothetical protein
MKLRNKNALLFVLAMALMVVSAGCPNSNTITSGTGTTQLNVVFTDPSRFEIGTFTISRILVRPLDPRASQALGSARDIKLTQSPIDAETALGMIDNSFILPVTLSQGVYEITELRMASLGFFDLDDPLDPSTCETSQLFYATSSAELINVNLASPPQFTVIDGQETALTLSYDLTAMMQTLSDAFTCTPGGPFGFSYTNFDENQFAANTLDYLTVD